MNTRHKVFGLGGILLTGLIGADIYRNMPDEKFYVKLDDETVVKVVRNYEPKSIGVFKDGFTRQIWSNDGDMTPDLTRIIHGIDIPVQDYPVTEKDRKDFEEAITKAGLKR